MHRFILITSTLALTLACTDAPGADDEAGTTTSPSTTDADASTDDGSTSTSTSSTSDDESSTATSTSSSTDDEDADSLFLPGPDVIPDACDPFAQDCPEGEKCVPSSWGGGGNWDWLRCVPVQGNQAAGEACTYDGGTETDNCDAASWCWNVDENGEGVCHLFCTGTADMPECPPMSQCTISGSGVINICISTCDPTLQNCPDGTACYWTNFDFNCVITTMDIPTGEPCGYVNDCALGNMCVDESTLPECEGPSCCANFCDLDVGDSQCDGAPGTACVAFFEVGRAPPGYAHVGLCILPP